MPNWCSNTLFIEGTEEDVARIVKTVHSGTQEFSLNAFLPTPQVLLTDSAPSRASNEEKERRRAAYGATDWYDWNVKNWGTKWDATDVDSQIESERAVYYFDTAWSPPVEAITTLSAVFHEATFILAYDEPGVDFGGYVVIRGGEIVGEEGGTSRMSSWADLAEYAGEGIGV